jgi:hypothetical protein
MAGTGLSADWWRGLGPILELVGALVLGAIAIFQERIRSWLYQPTFEISTECRPPDCVSIPMTRNITMVSAQSGEAQVITQPGPETDSIYLRVWVKNSGKTTAQSVEVYAKRLWRLRKDREWELVRRFPPMNLVWSNLRAMYLPLLPQDTGKHCDIAHIIDPANRKDFPEEENKNLNLTADKTSLTFDLVARPYHKGHIVEPGEYRLEVVVTAMNARPVSRTVEITLQGSWHSQEEKMLRDGVGIRVLAEADQRAFQSFTASAGFRP